MAKHVLKFERTTHETATVAVDLPDDVTDRMMQLWIESGINWRSPLDLPADQFPAQRTRHHTKWLLVQAEPPLASELAPTPYSIPAAAPAQIAPPAKRGRPRK